jgi:membrane protein YdbS with pleckstrin-like domain
MTDEDERPEAWVPVEGDTPEPPAAWRRAPPEIMLRTFLDMDDIPAGAEVVVRPSLRAALDVPFKVIGVLLFLTLPFGTTGAILGGPQLFLPFVPFVFLLQIAPALLITFAPAIRLVYTRYIIDQDGIRVRSQVLSATESRVPWEKVTAIEHRRTFFDRLLGIERLHVIAYGVRGTTLRLIGLRNARQLRDLTARKMREHATAETIFSND